MDAPLARASAPYHPTPPLTEVPPAGLVLGGGGGGGGAGQVCCNRQGSPHSPTEMAAAPDVATMQIDELRAEVKRLRAQHQQDQAQIKALQAQTGGSAPAPAAAAAAYAPAIPPQGGALMSTVSSATDTFMADDPIDSTPVENRQRKMVEDMFTQGIITQEEYEEMVQRMDRERELEQALERQKAAWSKVLEIWNSKGCKKGMAAIEKNWSQSHPNEPFSAAAIATLFRKRSGEPPEYLDLKEVGEFLAGGKTFMAEVRNAYIDTFDFTNLTFVDGLRTFLGTFRMPGESMLIERLMTVFARRYFECNPDFVLHLKPEKIAELRQAYTDYASGVSVVRLDHLGPLVRSLGGDLKWMKDEEIEEMTSITPKEYNFVQKTYYSLPEASGEQRACMSEQELSATIHKIHIAAKAARKQSAVAKVVKKEAEVAEALSNVNTKLSAEFSGEELATKLQLETKRLNDQMAALAHDRATAQTEADSTEQERLEKAPDVQIDLLTFLTMMAHKFGNDTAFVLAYSTIMLNTDAHNPRLTGQKRMSKLDFIESNRKTPDLAALSDMFMGGVYDEICLREIAIDTGVDMGDAPKRVAESPRALNVAPSFDIVGQKMYMVEQKGLKAPKRVKVGVTGMGITVFDLKDLPVMNVLFHELECPEWTPDKKARGVVIRKKLKGQLYLKTGECEAICADLTRNFELVKASPAAATDIITPDSASARKVQMMAGAPAPAKEPPPGWELRESTNYPGRHFFLHLGTGKTQWTPPTAQEIADADIAAAALQAAQQAQAAKEAAEAQASAAHAQIDQMADITPAKTPAVATPAPAPAAVPEPDPAPLPEPLPEPEQQPVPVPAAEPAAEPAAAQEDLVAAAAEADESALAPPMEPATPAPVVPEVAAPGESVLSVPAAAAAAAEPAPAISLGGIDFDGMDMMPAPVVPAAEAAEEGIPPAGGPELAAETAPDFAAFGEPGAAATSQGAVPEAVGDTMTF
jgi:hypothetical protein